MRSLHMPHTAVVWILTVCTPSVKADRRATAQTAAATESMRVMLIRLEGADEATGPITTLKNMA